MASLLALDPYVTDWLNLLTRWLHVVAGIVWIGSSFYFIALDNHLRPPKDERERDAGIGGETRSGFGTNSRTATRPPGFRAAWIL